MTPVDVSICIATYRRPAGLRDLLASIERQETERALCVEIIVVDNSPPDAENIVEEAASASRFAVRYLTQPEQNISLTRNVAVSAATGTWLWFVDDDEIADPNCLDRLLTAAQTHNADAVFGPVRSSFPEPPAEWMQELFERPISTTGAISTANRTSNTLVRRDLLATVDGPFDVAYGKSGGSDSFLFRQLANAGARLIDSSDAFVTEEVPPNRATLAWLRRRHRVQGQNYARQTVTLAGTRRSLDVVQVAAKAVAQVIFSFASMGLNWGKKTDRERSRLRLLTNVGKLEGLWGTTSVRDA